MAGVDASAVQQLRASSPREVGPYRMLAELGQGGMGRVLLGSGPDGRLVALKLVHEQFAEDSGFRARFRREVEASQAVSGAYTAAVIDADPDAPTPWLASVFVPGPSLHEAITTTGTLPEQPALRLAAGLATALTHIHRADLVHRDLKPSNVLLTDDGLRVIDFGIVRAISGDRTSELTRTGWLIGSPGFMSPEQAGGDPVTPASDVFSLGVVIVAACIGDSPFTDSSTLRTLNNIVRAEPDLTEVPASVRRIVEPCLDRDPANRPTPAEVLESIGPITPSARPWPTAVHELIARRQHGIAELLHEMPHTRTTTETGPPTVTETRLDTDPEPSPATTRFRPLRTGALIAAVVLIGILAWVRWGPALHTARTEFQQVGTISGTGSPRAVEFSPDGRTLAIAYTDGTLQLWDAENRQPTSQPLVAFADLDDLAFSPDGRTLTTAGVEAIGSDDGADERWVVQRWDVASGHQIGDSFIVEPHPDDASYINSPELLADGRTLVVVNKADSDAYVQLWDVASRRQTAQFDITKVAGFSPDGRVMATLRTTPDNVETLELWDAAGQRIGNPISLPEGESNEGLAFSSGGDLMVTTGYRDAPDKGLTDAGTIRFWNPADQNQVRQPIIHPDLRLDSIALSPDGHHLIGFSSSSFVELWNLDSGQKVDSLGNVKDVVFSPDGRTLVATGIEDDTVRIWLTPDS